MLHTLCLLLIEALGDVSSEILRVNNNVLHDHLREFYIGSLAVIIRIVSKFFSILIKSTLSFRLILIISITTTIRWSLKISIVGITISTMIFLRITVSEPLLILTLLTLLLRLFGIAALLSTLLLRHRGRSLLLLLLLQVVNNILTDSEHIFKGLSISNASNKLILSIIGEGNHGEGTNLEVQVDTINE